MAFLRRLFWLGAIAVLCVCPAQAAQPPFHFGVAWYPEQWPQQRWPRDLELMQRARINVVRIAEFSWSTLEPREGQYDFAWLDKAIAMAAQHHIQVVIGTPTAAPPAWLTQKYPDVLRVNENGSREEHGNRLQYSFSNERYRGFARDIAGRLAERYGHNPDVIGWQIDNEISPPSFDDGTRAQWHDWLKRKYGDIASLNAHWTTAYWSETYNDFDQVPMRSEIENPGLLLDFKRFVSDTWISYVRNQADAIRAHADPRQFVTTNTMHWKARFDDFALHRILDLAAWDNYVPDGHFIWADNALLHDAVRGYKQRNFWVMETQAAFVNYGSVNRTLDPGRMREMAWQAVGHGADALLYWQWRSALNGQEQYYGALVGPDGRPVPAYTEAARIGAEFAKAGAALAGTSPHARIAVIQSYESRWAIDFQRHNRDFDPDEELAAFYRPLEHLAQSVDIVSPDAPLERYSLVVAPDLNVLPKATAEHLADYVRRGGHLLLGPRSGMKDEYDTLWTMRQPGPLADVLGGHVEQYYALDVPVAIESGLGNGQASIWGEALASDDPQTTVTMRYGDGNTLLAGRPAGLTRTVGKGHISYLGAWLDEALMRRMLAVELAGAGVKPLIAGPDDVEVCERVGTRKQVLILINHGDENRTVALPRAMRNVLRRGSVRSVQLAPHDVAVLIHERKSAP